MTFTPSRALGLKSRLARPPETLFLAPRAAAALLCPGGPGTAGLHTSPRRRPPPPAPSPGDLAAPLQRQLRTRVAGATLTSDPKPAGKGPQGRSGPGGAQEKYSPEEVVFAIELAFPGEALLGQVAFTFTALDALDVPGPVQHVQEEAVQDGPFAASTVHHGLWFGRVRPGEENRKIEPRG